MKLMKKIKSLMNNLKEADAKLMFKVKRIVELEEYILLSMAILVSLEDDKRKLIIEGDSILKKFEDI